MSGKNKLYAIFLILILVFLVSGCGKGSKNKTTEEIIESKHNKVLKETNYYDGVYEIEYTTESGNYTFNGALEIKAGKIKLFYIETSEFSAITDNEKGFCGIYEDGNFYIDIDYEYSDSIYSCQTSQDGLICFTNLDDDLFGYAFYDTDNHNIKLIKSNKTYKELTDFYSQEVEQLSEQKKQAYEKYKAEIKQEEEQEKYDVEIDAVTISNVYYNNELDGNKKYFGKRIKTYGRYDYAEKGVITGWSVTLRTDGIYDYYCSTFKNGEEKHFSEYNRGETLVIYAKVDELVGSYLKLKDCDLERSQ